MRGVVVLVAAVLLAGCHRTVHREVQGDLRAAGVLVDYRAGTARARVGQLLVVSFGTVNSSIGDSWYLVTKPDPAVLTERGPRYESTCAANQVGCDSSLRWEFAAAAAGTTSMVFRYCYRSQPANCQPAPTGNRGPAEPVKLDVTVS
jgi:hypothetical protein